jgi:DNA repair protein RadC
MSISGFEDAPDFSDDYGAHADAKRVLTVKEQSSDDQPREKAKRYGVEALSNAELLALILRTGTPGYPITEMCRDIMQLHGNFFGNLCRSSIEQLKEIRGIGDTKAVQVMAIMEIVKRYGNEKVGDRPRITSSSDIFSMMRHVIGDLPHEEIWVVFLNRGNRVIGKMRVSAGSSVASVFDVKKILKNALLAHAEGVVLVHNHPSGTLAPSGPDDQITRRLKEACKQLDLTMLDHVIVTTDGHYSYMDQGRL